MSTKRKKFLFATLIVLAFLLALEGAARILETLLVPTLGASRGSTRPVGDFRIAFLGGSTVIGLPMPELGFVEQFKMLAAARFPDRAFTVDNFGAAGLPSAGEVQSMAKAISSPYDAIVLMSGHNEFIRPRMTEIEIERAYALGARLDRCASTRLLRSLWSRLANTRVETWKLESTTTEEVDFDRRVEAFRRHIAAIVRMAREARVPLILCTSPSNLADWPPSKPAGALRYAPAFEQVFRELLLSIEQGRQQEALARIEPLLQSDPRHAMLLYLRGQISRSAGRYEDALRDLRLALDYDPVPRRAPTAMNAAIRAYAGTDGVWVVDLEQLFQKRAVHGLPGFDLFADNCHPAPEGYYLIAHEVLETLERMRWVTPTATAREAPTVEQTLGQLGFSDETGALRLEYLARNVRYCMKFPFFNYPAAQRYLDEALRIAPERWDLWANQASMSLISGQLEKGRRELQRAVELSPDPIDPADKALAPYLETALQNSSLRLDGRRIVTAPSRPE